MRKVKFWMWEKSETLEQGQRKYEKKEFQGWFHGFGFSGMEVENGGITNSIAIVELSDGTIKNPFVEHCQFIEPLTSRVESMPPEQFETPFPEREDNTGMGFPMTQEEEDRKDWSRP